MPAAQNERLEMRVPADFKARLQEAARADHRSATDLVIAVMSCWLEGRRYEPIARPGQSVAGSGSKPAASGYSRPPGRPRAIRENEREQWLIDQLSRVIQPDGEYTTAELVAAVSRGDHHPTFGLSVDLQMLHIGFRQAIRASDEQRVWLGPDHPARAALLQP
ncbi:type II toxin-antitoxin system TacA family antitoxin [Sphingomonas baiyangensis]|uniref:Uncharacterized protein n=1 Tax=Sphingomonas baiyangensis TaxID=2572576 RepID=A0A4U1L3A0_9SPHN|nr:hypothetical protein [Sphingomonas baiyangensis]TKD50566.1 hypothetical protein FBR43_07155 [Sphingomonas baiyangensis]